MNFLQKVAIFFIYLITCQVICDELDIGNANEFIDEVLEGLRGDPTISKEIDPLKIPEFNDERLSVWDGTLKGLSSLYRYGDCTVTYEDETATVIGELGVRNIDLFVRYKAKALFFWIYGRIFGKLDNLAVRMTITAKERKANLTEFRVIDLGDYRITKITGVSFMFNWLLKLIANSIAQKSRDRIIYALENEAADALRELLKGVQVPL